MMKLPWLKQKAQPEQKLKIALVPRKTTLAYDEKVDGYELVFITTNAGLGGVWDCSTFVPVPSLPEDVKIVEITKQEFARFDLYGSEVRLSNRSRT
jgi:hypothetical protein